MYVYQEGQADQWNFDGEYFDVKTPAQITYEKRLAAQGQPDPEKAAQILEGKRRLAKSLAVPILFSFVMGGA